MKNNIHFSSYIAQVYLEQKCFRESCREIGTHILHRITSFFRNRAVYEIMWKNTVEWSRPQTTIWRMRIKCLIPKATNTHTVCVILIALPLQPRVHERASNVISVLPPLFLTITPRWEALRPLSVSRTTLSF
jgi:hypothetical protein